MDETRCSSTAPTKASNPAVAWTVKEAFACAYCWSEFSRPEETVPEDTPESYWLRISERARMECRKVAKQRMLVAVAGGQVVVLPHPSNLSDDQFASFGKEAGLKQRHRMWRIVMALRFALSPGIGKAKATDGVDV